MDFFRSLVLLGVVQYINCFGSFDYDNNSSRGPLKWANLFPKCGLANQSPINIETARINNNKTGRLTYNEYRNMIGKLKRKGHNIKFIPAIRDRKLSGVYAFPETQYTLQQFHFHWGRNINEGSEHAINGRRYPGELHIVHYNSDAYPTFEKALGKNNGITVVAVFLEISAVGTCRDKDVLGSCENIPRGYVSNLDKFIRTYLKQGIGRAFMNLEDLNPEFQDFYTYIGTTTTPKCHENVRWIIMENTIKISQEAWLDLQTITDRKGVKISVFGNSRPIQNLTNRQVTRYRVSEEFT